MLRTSEGSICLCGGVDAVHGLLGGRTIWTVTPSAVAGSGPAEIVAPLVGYARGLGIDARWLTLDAPAEFLTISSRLHAAMHGDRGDGGRLADKQRDIYEHVLASNADNVADEVRYRAANSKNRQIIKRGQSYSV